MAPGLTASPVYDNQDRLLSYGACSYGYKADGSLQTKTCPDGTTTYDYDALGNLRHVTLTNGTNIDYVIDGQNRRVGKKVNGVLVEGFVYRNQLQPAAWLNGDGSLKASFVYGSKPNEPEYIVKGGISYRLITDQVGSVRLVVDSADNVAERIDYDEFGNVLADSAPGFQPFAFAGGLQDADTGLLRFGSRDYEPATSRWTARDGLKFAGGDGDLYAYSGDDPLNRADPFGQSSMIVPLPGPWITPYHPGPESWGAWQDYWNYYLQMRHSNWIGQDKYFHCLANCHAASRGFYGRGAAWAYGWMREWTDWVRKNDTWAECRQDLDADARGRLGPNPDCATRCESLRPRSMPRIP